MIASSPAWWPYVSLIDLKWSMSRHDQAAGQVRFLMGGDEVVQHPVELGPVGHLRHRVLGDLGVQRLALFFERRFRRHVVQQHRRAVDGAVVAAHGNRVQVDRHVPALPAHDADAAQPLHAGARSRAPRGNLRSRSRCSRLLHMSIRLGRNVRPQAAALLTPVSRSTPVFHSRIVAWLSTNTTPSCMLSISFFSNSERRRVGGRVDALVFGGRRPRQHAAVLRQAMQPAAGQLFGQQVLILREQLLELPHQFRIELAAGELEQLGQRPFARAGRAVDVVGGHRVERVDDRQHPRRQRQLVALAILRPAVAVVPGPAVVDDFEQRLAARRSWRRISIVQAAWRDISTISSGCSRPGLAAPCPARRSCRRRAAARPLPAGRGFRRRAPSRPPTSCSRARRASNATPSADAWPAAPRTGRWPFPAGPAPACFRGRLLVPAATTGRFRRPLRPAIPAATKSRHLRAVGRRRREHRHRRIRRVGRCVRQMVGIELIGHGSVGERGVRIFHARRGILDQQPASIGQRSRSAAMRRSPMQTVGHFRPAGKASRPETVLKVADLRSARGESMPPERRHIARRAWRHPLIDPVNSSQPVQPVAERVRQLPASECRIGLCTRAECISLAQALSSALRSSFRTHHAHG